MDDSPLPTFLRVHQFSGLLPGPKLIVLGAVHGNETCGTRAIERVIREIERGAIAIQSGSLTFVPVTNPLAFQKGRRQGDRNLNRNLGVTAQPRDFEDRVANALCPLLAANDVLLDLHSFQAPGQPFITIGPGDNSGDLEPFAHAQSEARLVAHLGPRRVIEGWMQAYARGVKRRQASGQALAPGLLDARYGVGTTEYMRASGGYGATLECGQHDDPAAPEVAYRAICQTLALLRIAAMPALPPGSDFEILRLVDVIDREHAEDQFVRPWASFDTVASGQAIAQRKDGRMITAPEEGLIVFPNSNAPPGAEWFYFAQRSQRSLV